MKYRAERKEGKGGGREGGREGREGEEGWYYCGDEGREAKRDRNC